MIPTLVFLLSLTVGQERKLIALRETRPLYFRVVQELLRTKLDSDMTF